MTLNPQKQKFFDLRLFYLCIATGVLMTGMRHVGLEKKTLDGRLFYTGHESVSYFDTLSSLGNAAYLHFQFVDFAFLITYGSLIFLALSRLYPPSSRMKWWGILPSVLDFVESTIITLCLVGQARIVDYPWLGYVTFLKWAGVIFFTLLILFQYARSRVKVLQFRKAQ